jgi:hypothetical protein
MPALGYTLRNSVPGTVATPLLHTPPLALRMLIDGVQGLDEKHGRLDALHHLEFFKNAVFRCGETA